MFLSLIASRSKLTRLVVAAVVVVVAVVMVVVVDTGRTFGTGIRLGR